MSPAHPRIYARGCGSEQCATENICYSAMQCSAFTETLYCTVLHCNVIMQRLTAVLYTVSYHSKLRYLIIAALQKIDPQDPSLPSNRRKTSKTDSTHQPIKLLQFSREMAEFLPVTSSVACIQNKFFNVFFSFTSNFYTATLRNLFRTVILLYAAVADLRKCKQD